MFVYPCDCLVVQPQIGVFLGDGGIHDTVAQGFGDAFQAGFHAGGIFCQSQQFAVGGFGSLLCFRLPDCACALQFVGFVQNVQRVALVQSHAQLQAGETGEARIDLGGGGELFGSGGVVLLVQCAFCQHQMAGKLLFCGQLGDLGEILVAQAAVAALVGCVGGNHQGKYTAFARFFVV